jgi:aminodeoxyfutalosine synthase
MLGADVLTLGMAADEMRRAELATSRVTYLRVHEVSGDDIARGVQVPDAAREVRLYRLPDSFDAAVVQVRAMKAAAGLRRVAAFSLADLFDRGWATSDRVQMLADAGLDDVAELPADQLEDLEASLHTLRAGGVEPQRVTVSRPLGARREDIIDRVQRVFETDPLVRRFAPLPRVAAADQPTTGYDDVRTIALARLALRSRSIEVDWRLYGPKLAQVSLTFGADHLDAVPATDDASLGPRRTTIEDVERNIRAAGFEPSPV